MENRFLNNKIIIKYCPDYYRIINERFSSLDIMSEKVINIYQSYIFSINPRVRSDLKRAIELNKAICVYFDDRDFRTELSNHLKGLRVSKKEENILLYIVNSVLDKYNKYKEGYTRNLYIPRWV